MKVKLEFSAETPAGPVMALVPGASWPSGQALRVRDEAMRVVHRGQHVRDGVVCMLLPAAGAGEPLTLDVAPLDRGVESNLTARQESDKVTVLLGGGVFGVFRFEPDRPKPILWPVIGPSGLPLTRAWPMSEDVPDDSRDHVHQQSLWVAHGDVNGVDFWSMAEGHGVQRVRNVSVVQGPVAVVIDARIDWLAPQDQRVMTERRQVVFWDPCESRRFIDVISRLEMTQGPVRFGDTKEGGMISVRVASSMEEKRGHAAGRAKDAAHEGAEARPAQGGRITNGFGAAGEAACWGKPAPWCDYAGPVEGRTVGIAVLDHPANFRHPVTWHVRAYGLMAANPFGLSAFASDPSRDGSHTWQKAEVVEYRYRLVLHDGDAAAAGIQAQWRLFASGPLVEVV